MLVVDVRQTDQGVDLCRDVLSRHREVKCIVLTAFNEDGLLDAVLTGAAGYLSEGSSEEALTTAIRRAAAGTRSLPLSWPASGVTWTNVWLAPGR